MAPWSGFAPPHLLPHLPIIAANVRTCTPVSARVRPRPSVSRARTACLHCIKTWYNAIDGNISWHGKLLLVLFRKKIQTPPLTPCFPLLKFDFRGSICCHGGQWISGSYEVCFQIEDCLFFRIAYYSCSLTKNMHLFGFLSSYHCLNSISGGTHLLRWWSAISFLSRGEF